MAKIPVCPYCNYEIDVIPHRTSIICPKCGSEVRVQGGKLYKSEEVPSEISCCFTGIFANIARVHEGSDEGFQEFLDEFLRNKLPISQMIEKTEKIIE